MQAAYDPPVTLSVPETVQERRLEESDNAAGSDDWRRRGGGGRRSSVSDGLDDDLKGTGRLITVLLLPRINTEVSSGSDVSVMFGLVQFISTFRYL